MKVSYLHFLSKANMKGSKIINSVTFLICLLVVTLTVISSYSVVLVRAINRYKEDYKARAVYISPAAKPITEDLIDLLSSIEHVDIVADVSGMLYGTQYFNIVETNEVEVTEQIDEVGSRICVCGLYEKEEKSVVKGKSLDKAPTFSCLVPSIFYPYEDADERNFKDLEYIDGSTLIGKTITVAGYGGDVDFSYYVPGDNGYCEQVRTKISTPEFILNIVGTYPCSYGSSGNFRSIYVSRETELLMTQMTLERAGVDLSTDDSDLARWWNDPSLHCYMVVIDDYSNVTQVANDSYKLGYGIGSVTELLQDDVTVLLALIFKTVGTFLTVAIGLISIILLVQSSVSAINERKGYIGLMKAIGYKNRQVFLTLLWEQLCLSLRAFVIGGAVSTALVYLINLYFEHGTYRQLQYVMDWNVYFAFLGLAFLIVLLVPIVTELILIRKLVKIEPRDAMTVK